MITRKQQTTPSNCVCACLAMIAEYEVDNVTSEFDQRYKSDPNVSVSDYLREHDIYHYVLAATVRITEPGFIYILSVPSINILGGSHSIVVHHTSDDEWLLFDPNYGRPGIKYYVNGRIEDELAVQILSYRCIVRINEQHLERWRIKKVMFPDA